MLCDNLYSIDLAHIFAWHWLKAWEMLMETAFHQDAVRQKIGLQPVTNNKTANEGLHSFATQWVIRKTLMYQELLIASGGIWFLFMFKKVLEIDDLNLYWLSDLNLCAPFPAIYLFCLLFWDKKIYILFEKYFSLFMKNLMNILCK